MISRAFPRIALWAVALGVAVSATPASAQRPPQPPPPPVRTAPFSPWWVVTSARSSLWSEPGPAAREFGPLPAGAILQVVGPIQGRIPVWNPLTDGYAWIDAGVVEPIDEPAAEEIEALKSFTPWWGMNHRPATAWSSEASDADAWGQIPMWRYLQVISPPYSGRVLTLDARTEASAYVDVEHLGPVGEPPQEYFAPPPSDEEVIGLPGRTIRETDWYEVPDAADHFSVERFQTNFPLQVLAGVTGRDESPWYRVGPLQYVPARNVRLPQPPERTFPGRWIDANLSEPVLLTAYEDDRPIYSALAVKGTVAFQTPTGVFRIWRRVENETMDSLTLGIPRTHRDGYYLKDVLFTQYFTGDGAALHYNYWRSDWGHAGSHGCLGLNYDDSLFFWHFATVGTPVYVR